MLELAPLAFDLSRKNLLARHMSITQGMNQVVTPRRHNTIIQLMLKEFSIPKPI
jgi:hypothetical protein